MADSQGEIAYQQAHADESRVGSLRATFIVCFVMLFVSVIGRFVARAVGKVRLGWDDWLMVASLVFGVAFMSLNVFILSLGLGRHQIFVTDAKGFVLGFALAEVFYTTSIALTKTSTLLLWHRLFPGRGIKITLWVIGAVLFSYSITQIVCIVVQCVPLSTLWDPEVEGHCIDLPVAFVVLSSFNIVTDVAILAVPITRLWKLEMTNAKKLQLTGLFLLGGFVLVISIIRLPQLKEISPLDESWTLTNSAIWSSLECSIAALSACLPVMRPLWLWATGGLKSQVTRSKTSGAHSGWVTIEHDGTRPNRFSTVRLKTAVESERQVDSPSDARTVSQASEIGVASSYPLADLSKGDRSSA